MAGARCFAQVASSLATLLVWGRSSDGRWWALVCWDVPVATPSGSHSTVRCSAWCPSAAVTPSAYEQHTYPQLVRIALPDDQQHWPGPAWRPSTSQHHYGVLTDRPDGVPGHTLFRLT